MKLRVLLCAVLLAANVIPAVAEELQALVAKVTSFAEQGNYPKALEELAWVEKELQKRHTDKLTSLLPASISGLEGQPVQAQSALGMSTLERAYGQGGQRIKLSLTGTGSSGAAAGGGLAALGRMGAMMGQQPGTDTFRVDGRTATLRTQGNRSELTLFMESGAILKLEQSGSKDGSALKEAVESMQLDKLDAYLKGQA